MKHRHGMNRMFWSAKQLSSLNVYIFMLNFKLAASPSLLGRSRGRWGGASSWTGATSVSHQYVAISMTLMWMWWDKCL